MYRVVAFAIGFFAFVSTGYAQVPHPAHVGGEATFEGLGCLRMSSVCSEANDVSGDGSVVVGQSIHSTAGGNREAFRWESGTMEGLGTPPGTTTSSSKAVSNDGSVVIVNSWYNGAQAVFSWTDEAGMVLLEGLLDTYPGGVDSWEASADGSVVVGRGDTPDGLSEAFVWKAEGDTAVVVGLGNWAATGVSADGSVVSGYMNSGGWKAFRWTEEEGKIDLGDLEGGDGYAAAYGISADGSTVVGESVSANGLEAFRWTEGGRMEGLGDLPGGEFGSLAWAASADGSVVIGYSSAHNGNEAFIWTEEDGMRNLKEVLETDYGLDLTGWTLRTPAGISDDGTVIVGKGRNPEGVAEAYRVFLGKPVAGETPPDALADVLGVPRPNPASRVATVTLAVERGQQVSVEVFDAMGRRVQTLYNGALAAGVSETLTVDASTLPSGVYAIRATGEDFARTRSVTVVH